MADLAISWSAWSTPPSRLSVTRWCEGERMCISWFHSGDTHTTPYAKILTGSTPIKRNVAICNWNHIDGKRPTCLYIVIIHIINAGVKDPFLTSIHCARRWLSAAISSKLIIFYSTSFGETMQPRFRENHDKNGDTQYVIANTGSVKFMNGTLDVLWFSLICRKDKVWRKPPQF